MSETTTLQSMEELLASIRDAIHEHSASREGSGTASSPGASRSAAFANGWRHSTESAPDDDLLWADQMDPSAHEETFTPYDRHDYERYDDLRTDLNAHRQQSDHHHPQSHPNVFTTAAPAGDATAANVHAFPGPAFKAENQADLKPSTFSASHSSGVRRPASLRVVNGGGGTASFAETATAGGAARATLAGAAPRLSTGVQQRVRSAMRRLERIEELKTAVGGEEAFRDLVNEVLRPMLSAWLEKNLPEIVERLVAEELARITGRDDGR